MAIKIRILNPNTSDLEKTRLTVDVSSGTSITVDSVSGLAENTYIIVGNIGSDSAELKKISSISGLVITIDSAISHSHLADEPVTKTLYNQTKIYRATSSGGSLVLVDTIALDYSNHNNETVYVDSTGSGAKYYKTTYYNSQASTESDYSDELKGSGLFAYISLAEFRLRTGITGSDVSDSVLTGYLNRAANKIKDKSYIFRRRNRIDKTTIDSEERYYFDYFFIADSNLDGVVDKNDLEVLERNNDGTTENDITAQVNTLNQYDGYFTLNDGYPTSTDYAIYVTYRWTRKPLAEVTEDMEELNLCIAMEWIVRRQMTDAFKRGISSQSVPGLTINRSPDIFKEMLKEYTSRTKELFNKLKPIRFVKWRGHTDLTQTPGRVVQPLKTDRIAGEETLTQRIEKLRKRN